jgi:MtN3 and saliva related transmembrane protein
MKTIEVLLGIVYNVAFISCYWPQIIKSWRTKRVTDVSIHLFTLSVIGYLSAIGYTLLRGGFDLFWLFNYTFSLGSAILMIFIYYRYRKNG